MKLMNINTIGNIVGWFRKAVPQPAPQNISTQLGVHCEEVAEMLMEISTTDLETSDLLEAAYKAVHELAVQMKSKAGCVFIPNDSRKLYLDALCDQIITAIGCAHMQGMNIDGALIEVNQSNWSKFDNIGQPIFDENMKVTKGPHYVKPDLMPYV